MYKLFVRLLWYSRGGNPESIASAEIVFITIIASITNFLLRRALLLKNRTPASFQGLSQLPFLFC
jgi:hypothetical protein